MVFSLLSHGFRSFSLFSPPVVSLTMLFCCPFFFSRRKLVFHRFLLTSSSRFSRALQVFGVTKSMVKDQWTTPRHFRQINIKDRPHSIVIIRSYGSRDKRRVTRGFPLSGIYTKCTRRLSVYLQMSSGRKLGIVPFHLHPYEIFWMVVIDTRKGRRKREERPPL